MSGRFLKKVFWFGVVVFFLGAIAAGVGATWGYIYITRDLPRLDKIEDYRPPAVTTIYDDSDNILAEFYTEQRYPVRISEVPLMVRNAFLAAEDSSFYSHPGIDIISILRAMVKNLKAGEASQGASTITQQVVKNLLLTSQKRLERKVKEAILSYRLEQRFSKDEIFEIYLNQMFFGNGAYGIRAAGKIYFHKELKDLSLAEAATLAGLLKAPSRYSPARAPELAQRRRRYVLDQMVRSQFVTQELADAAAKEDLKVYPAANEKFLAAPYYSAEVRRLLTERLGSEAEVDNGGYVVHTALNLTAQRMAESALAKALREVDKRRGWRGAKPPIPVEERAAFIEKLKKQNGAELLPGKVYQALVTSLSKKDEMAWVDLGTLTSSISLREASWAKKKLSPDDKVSWIKLTDEIKEGSIIEVALKDVDLTKDTDPKTPGIQPAVANALQLDQSPDIEGAFILIDPHTGRVVALVGGYDYHRSVFNRATQSLRQPGSCFKPVAYLAAVDGFGYTPSTIVYDQPREFQVGDQVWQPANFDEDFLGPITLQTALEKSRNLATVDIVSRIGLDPVIQYAAKLGIKSKLGHNPSLALGSSEVTLLEMVRAYGTFAAKGVLFDSAFITEIKDRNGNIIYDYTNEMLAKAQQVINPNTAFVMAHLMTGTIQRGTGIRVKALGRPVAGKTGTSNDQMDTWFIGYTPEWAAGVWVGFDLKKEIGEKETGGRVAAPAFIYFMQDFLTLRDKQKYEQIVEEGKAEAARLGIDPEPVEPIKPLDFSVPDGVDPFWMNKNTGAISTPDDPDAILEYFIKGTRPNDAGSSPGTQNYLESDL